MSKKVTSLLSKKRLNELIALFPKAKILVVGDLILDEFVWGKVNRISPEAPVPVVEVVKQSFMPGGALNVANNIRALGGAVCPCGIIGRDLYGKMLSRVLRQNKIETGGIITDKSRPTSLKTRVIAHSQQVVRFDKENKEPMSQQDIERVARFCIQQMTHVDVIVIEDYGKGVITPQLLKKILPAAKKHKVPVLVDPKEKHVDYYKGVTALTPNLKEAAAMVDLEIDSKPAVIERIGKKLIKQLSCQAALVTLGEQGMALFEKSGNVSYIPTTAQEVFDVSGAGDTVIATFALVLACGGSLKEAALISNYAAGIVVGKLGTATVSPSELKQVSL